MSPEMRVAILVLLFGGGLLPAAESPTTQPATQSTPAEAFSGDPNFIAGREAAKKQLADGIVGQMLAVPEAFFLEWHGGMPDENLFPYYQAIVAARYHIVADYRIFIPGPTDSQLYVLGYNEQMKTELEKRCSSAKLQKTWVEACHTSSKRRQAYLNAREAKQAAPASQPAEGGSNAGPELNK